MAKEEILADLLDNCVWDVYGGHLFVTDDGELQIPYDNECDVDFILIPADDWVERMTDEDDLSALPDEDVKWVVDKITKYFAYRQRLHSVVTNSNCEGAD